MDGWGCKRASLIEVIGESAGLEVVLLSNDLWETWLAWFLGWVWGIGKGLWILVTGCDEDLLFTEWVDRDLFILSGFAPWSKFTRGADNIAGQFVFPPSQERRTSTRRSLIYIVYSLICSEGIYNELFSFIVLNTSVCGGGETEKRQFAFVYENNKDSGKLIWIHLLSLLYHHRSSHNAWDLLEDPWIWVFSRWSGLVV